MRCAAPGSTPNCLALFGIIDHPCSFSGGNLYEFAFHNRLLRGKTPLPNDFSSRISILASCRPALELFAANADVRLA